MTCKHLLAIYKRGYMQYLNEFLLLAMALHVALASPGPDFMITLRQTINYGKKYAYYSSFGIGFGIACHLIYTLMGLNVVISQFPYIFEIIKISGALYLIYLGVMSLKNKTHAIKIAHEKKQNLSLKKFFLMGFLSDLLNPKTTLFFVSIFTSIVSINTPIHIQFLYGLYCVFANIIWYMMIANILSKDANLRLFNKYQKNIERAIGIILIALGIKLIF